MRWWFPASRTSALSHANSTGWNCARRCCARSRTAYPLLGICAGFQLLFERSDEAPEIAGLGIFTGNVRRVRTPRIPHMGWNRVTATSGRRPEGWAYFAHSYAPDSDLPDIVATTIDGSDVFGSMAERGSAIGAQFHPERSGAFGAELLARFVAGATVSYAR